MAIQLNKYVLLIVKSTIYKYSDHFNLGRDTYFVESLNKLKRQKHFFRIPIAIIAVKTS